MNPTDKNITPLRRLAEAEFSRAQKQSPKRILSPDALLHELQVHQIELEIQNHELQLAQLALEKSRNLYLNLFEFAPIAFLILTANGLNTHC